MKLILVIVFLSLCLELNAQISNGELLLRHLDPKERIRGAQTLGSAGSENGIRALIGALEDQDPFVRAAVRAALLKIGRPAWDALLRMLESDALTVRASVANTLINLLGKDAQSTGSVTPPLDSLILEKTSFARCFEGVCLESWVRPVYPVIAQSANVSGRVWVSFDINQTGQAENIFAKGHPLLIDDLPKVLEQWRFSGSAVGRSMLFDFQFVRVEEATRAFEVDIVLPNYVLIVTHSGGIMIGVGQ